MVAAPPGLQGVVEALAVRPKVIMGDGLNPSNSEWIVRPLESTMWAGLAVTATGDTKIPTSASVVRRLVVVFVEVIY